VISHRFRSTADSVESVVALNRWDNAWFSQILMTRGLFKTDLTGGLMQIEDAVKCGDHGSMQGAGLDVRIDTVKQS